jgi:ABC-type nickel/cobalt efflux system permease component RcnA
VKLLKSIGAVFAGMLVVVILSTGTDLILEQCGIFPLPTNGLFIT